VRHPQVLVLCVGNPYRRDDGVGLEVLAALPPSLGAKEVAGDAADLVARWSGAERVVLVDAVSTGAAPGTVLLLRCVEGSWDGAPPPAAASTHGLGLAEAVGLGSALGTLPAHLTLVGVEVGDTVHGLGLSAPVAAAVPVAVARVTQAAESRY
jgi:hydrogenase maturation protease